VSQTTAARKKVIVLRYSTATHTVAKRQKLRSASREEIVPKAKAEAVVRDVIVIAGPACDSASCTR